MNRADKTKLIADVKSRFDRAISVALVDFQGLSVATVTALRKEFRKAKVDYRVLKNTVIRHALKGSAYQTLVGDLTPGIRPNLKAHDAVRGMTGVAFSYEDPSAPAKVVEEFKKKAEEKAAKLRVKTGMVGGQLITGEALAKMPGLKETQGQIVGLIEAPGANLYATLLAPAIHVVAILDTWVENRKAAGEQ